MFIFNGTSCIMFHAMSFFWVQFYAVDTFFISKIYLSRSTRGTLTQYITRNYKLFRHNNGESHQSETVKQEDLPVLLINHLQET